LERDGVIVALGRSLDGGEREIDASGLLTMPGGVDGHWHLDQPMPDGLRMADDFFTGTRAAVCGGTTTVIPFAAQEKGGSLRAAVEDYHRRANGRAVTDYGFRLIVADPTEKVLREELPQLIREGYTSFKIYMTYDDLKLSDRSSISVTFFTLQASHPTRYSRRKRDLRASSSHIPGIHRSIVRGSRNWRRHCGATAST
jgi:dihydropyrimidinase